MCVVCSKSNCNLQKCGNCKATHYCSRECQKSDWKSHKAICKDLCNSIVKSSDPTKKIFRKFIKTEDCSHLMTSLAVVLLKKKDNVFNHIVAIECDDDIQVTRAISVHDEDTNISSSEINVIRRNVMAYPYGQEGRFAILAFWCRGVVVCKTIVWTNPDVWSQKLDEVCIKTLIHKMNESFSLCKTT